MSWRMFSVSWGTIYLLTASLMFYQTDLHWPSSWKHGLYELDNKVVCQHKSDGQTSSQEIITGVQEMLTLITIGFRKW